MIQCCLCEDWFHEEHLGLESSAEVGILEFDVSASLNLFILCYQHFVLQPSVMRFLFSFWKIKS